MLSSFHFPAFIFTSQVPLPFIIILFCLFVFISYNFLFVSVIFAPPPPPKILLPLCCCCYVVAVPRPACPAPPSLAPVSRPCEREGVRRLRHSLGCFSTLVPWADKAPPPLQPLSLRSPDSTSWYSGLCPCLPGTVSFSSPSLLLCSHLLTSWCLFFINVLMNAWICSV